MSKECVVTLRTLHKYQTAIIKSLAKRKVVRAGRRSGKTVGVATIAVKMFLDGHRILYATPTEDQIGTFWFEVKKALAEPIDAGVFTKNETMHFVDLPGTKQRIRAKTAYNADTLRGDFADVLILDEFQLMDEEAWNTVGAPMLLDNNGDAIFIYTPPSLHSRSVSKARDPQHAGKLFKRAAADETGRWATFHFKSADNPHISEEALAEISQDMTSLAYRQEILAEDVDEAPGALWTRATIDAGRVTKGPGGYELVIVGVDPSATSTGDEAGIVTAGKRGDAFYILADDTMQASPLQWATAAVTAYHRHEANFIVAEGNNGGEMVRQVLKQVDPTVQIRMVHASRGKQTRAEPIAAIYEKGNGHHVGVFSALEDEMALWVPGDPSPNRMDALVWACAGLLTKQAIPEFGSYQG